MKKTAYVFLDEGGNFDFSRKGTSWFSLTSITKYRPFQCCQDLINTKYDLIEDGVCVEYFHASEDRQVLRDAVFLTLQKHLAAMRIDSVLVDKKKTNPTLYPVEKFYPLMLFYLLRYVFEGIRRASADEIIVFTDSIPVKKKRSIVVKAIKDRLADCLPDIPYKLFHHESKSNMGLQIADYCNWAIYKKWETQRKELRPYNYIRNAISSEYDIFAIGQNEYY